MTVTALPSFPSTGSRPTMAEGQGLTARVPEQPRTVAFDFPGVSIGVAEYDEGPTGCTAILLDRLALLAIDVRGGMPGVYNSTASVTEAVCLAGGSSLGLEASSGVAAELYAQRGQDPLKLPAVTGGVIYDYAAPGRTGVYADRELGRACARAAVAGEAPVGPVGAGRSATCGKLGRAGWAEPGGQGAAFGLVGTYRVLVLVVINSLGVIIDRDGHVVRGNRDPVTGQRRRLTAADMLHGQQRQRERFLGRFSDATTLTVVITDARLQAPDLLALSRQTHASLARAIHPFHAAGDGDALWFLSTGSATDDSISPTALGEFTSELAWDAVLCGVDAG